MKNDIVIHERNPLWHFVSCAVAFIVYTFFLFTLFHQSNEDVAIKIDDFSAQLALDDSIELTDVVEIQPTITPQEKEQEPVIQEPTPTELETVGQKIQDILQLQESVVQPKIEIPKPAPKKNIDLNDVFSNITSQTAHDRREQEEMQRLEEEAIKRKTEQEEQVRLRKMRLEQSIMAIGQSAQALEKATQNLSNNVRQVLETKIDIQRPKYSGSKVGIDKYNQWFSQIEQTLASEWNRSKKTYQATGAVIRIRFDSNGKLTFLYTVKPSPYADYNSSVISFIKEMEKRTFPPAPDSKNMELNINLNSARR